MSLQKAAKRLKQHLTNTDPCYEELDVDEDIFPVAVSVDGTWQKRYGFSSLHGLVFIMSMDTGEVLD